MKARKRKKFPWRMCSHNKTYDFVVTDDPYTMYDAVFVCSLKALGVRTSILVHTHARTANISQSQNIS